MMRPARSHQKTPKNPQCDHVIAGFILDYGTLATSVIRVLFPSKTIFTKTLSLSGAGA